MAFALDNKCFSVSDYNDGKQIIIKQFGINAVDTGSSSVQIALLTYRISYLMEHIKENHNDKSARYALLFLVAKRNKLMKYLKRKDINEYNKVTDLLKIRKK